MKAKLGEIRNADYFKNARVQKKYHNARLEQDKKLYKTQIDLLDHQIDTLVYKVYGLTQGKKGGRGKVK